MHSHQHALSEKVIIVSYPLDTIHEIKAIIRRILNIVNKKSYLLR